MIDLSQVATGRHAHDQGRVAALPIHTVAADRPPLVLDRSSLAFLPGDYGNSTKPICTAVAKFNTARAYSWANAHTDIVADPAKPEAFFAEALGIPNTDAAVMATDGAVMLDIAEYAATHGIDFGQQTRLVPSFVAIDFANRMALADAVLRFGAADIGVALAMADQQMPVWDTDTPASAGDPTAGSWGLHDTFIWDWDGLDDTSLVRLGTWGYWQKATWRWATKAIEEAYRLRWRQLDPAPVA